MIEIMSENQVKVKGQGKTMGFSLPHVITGQTSLHEWSEPFNHVSVGIVLYSSYGED